MSKRKRLSPDEKVAILRRHLLEGVPVSDLSDEYGIHATQVHSWQKQLFENAAGAFERRPNKGDERRRQDANTKKIAQLEEKLQPELFTKRPLGDGMVEGRAAFSCWGVLAAHRPLSPGCV